MMMTRMRAWAASHISVLFLTGAGAVLVIAVLLLAASLTGSAAVSDDEVTRLKHQLQDERDAAQTELDEQHTELMNEIGSMDRERVLRDRRTGRSIVTVFADTAGSGLPLNAQQQKLSAEHDFLNPDSQPLVDFLPEWLAVTRASGTQVLRITDLDQQLADVQALTYRYLLIAELTPVGADEPAQYLLVSLTTTADGGIDELSVSRASNATRDRLVRERTDAPASQTTETTSTKPTADQS